MLKLRYRPALFATLTALALGGCAKEEEKKAGLVLALQTDMAVPKDVDEVRIKVSVYGDIKHEMVYQVGENGLQIPATLTLLPPEDSSKRATIEVVSFQKGKARTLRQVITAVPENREALLRMPIHWLSDGMVAEGPAENPGAETKTVNVRLPGLRPQADGAAGAGPEENPWEGLEPQLRPYHSTCPEGESAVNGTCVSDVIDSTVLPDYVPAEVFGAKNADSGATCFRTLSCFADYQIIPTMALDFEGCGIALTDIGALSPSPTGEPEGLNIDKLNFAIITGTSGDGICASGEDTGCFVPLDLDSKAGWRIEGELVHLPPAICTKLEENPSYTLVGSDSCTSKTPINPTCGPWSSVGGLDDGEEPRPIAEPSGGSTGAGGSTAAGGSANAGGTTAAGGATSVGGTAGIGGAPNGGTGSGGAQSGAYQHVVIQSFESQIIATSNPLGISGNYNGYAPGTQVLWTYDTVNEVLTAEIVPVDSYVSLVLTLDSVTELSESALAGFAYQTQSTFEHIFGVTIDGVQYCANPTTGGSQIVPFNNLTLCDDPASGTRPPASGYLEEVFWKIEATDSSLSSVDFSLDSFEALQVMSQ